MRISNTGRNIFKLYRMSKEISKSKRAIVYHKFNGRCAYCGEKIPVNKFHVDHIKPKFRGYTPPFTEKGTNHIDNLNPSCPSCNIAKSTFTVEQFREQIKLKIDRMRRDSTNFRMLERYKLIKCMDKKEVVFHFEKIK